MSFTVIGPNGDEVQIVDIDFKNPDYRQWGVNCANLKFTEQATKDCWFSYMKMIEPDPERWDEFWDGYYSVMDKVVVKE